MIEFTVNGERRELAETSPSMPLLWVLRDHLKLTGTKFGCGMGLCGACTVHLDGVAVRSCQLPVAAVAGHSITTIEGLSPTEQHPLQLAWVAEDVPQCGYCQSGQIMSAAALLNTGAVVTDDSIRNAMSGNLVPLRHLRADQQSDQARGQRAEGGVMTISRWMFRDGCFSSKPRLLLPAWPSRFTCLRALPRLTRKPRHLPVNSNPTPGCVSCPTAR